MSSTPGPAYRLQSSRNGIVEAQYYIITFVIALIIQDYIRNGLELFVASSSLQLNILLFTGLMILLAFAFEWYSTASGRADSLRRGEVRFEFVRALLGLFALFGLHNFSLVLSRFTINRITVETITSQFAWGLAVIYCFYFGIRLVITAQNFLYGKDVWERPTAALGLYIVYVAFWCGFAKNIPRLGNWTATALFVIGTAATVGTYFLFWQKRYATRLGLDTASPAR
jgi:hypothetical protein